MERPAHDEPSQRERFIEKARELECDEDEAKFDATMERVLKKGEPAGD